MSTTTLPNIRVSSDLTVRVRLKDGGVAIDWSTLNNIKAHIYSDAQRALAGRCDVSVDAEDSTLLVCSYAANKPQYVGINRIVVSAKYMGETKTYDKPAFNFVRWTADQEGEEITIDDPDVDVEIEVEDVTSSILQEAIDAALQAAADAEHAAHLVPLEVLQDCEQATADAIIATAAANAAGIDEVQATVDAQVGTPSVDVDLENKVLSLDFHNMKGETGEAAGFGTASASLTEDGGDPSVTVSASGPDTAKQFAFTFKNLKGDKGDKGDQGNTGSSVDYPYELVNNCTTNDATKGLAASQGVALAGEVSQLEAKLTEENLHHSFKGQGATFVSTLINGLTPGRSYFVVLNKSLWTINETTNPTGWVFSLQSVDASDVKTNLEVIYAEDFATIKDYYKITLPSDCKQLRIGGRADTGQTIWFDVFDYLPVNLSNLRTAIPYFYGADAPTFELIQSGLQITLPSVNLGLYTDDGREVEYDLTSQQNLTFVLDHTKKLVYNFDTNVVELVGITSSGNYYVLLYIAGDPLTTGAIDGGLRGYYLAWLNSQRKADIRNANSAINNNLRSIGNIDLNISKDAPNSVSGFSLDNAGDLVARNGYIASNLFSVTGGTKILWQNGWIDENTSYGYLVEFDTNGNKLHGWTMNANPRAITLDSLTVSVRASFIEGREDIGIYNAEDNTAIFVPMGEGGIRYETEQLREGVADNALNIGSLTKTEGTSYTKPNVGGASFYGDSFFRLLKGRKYSFSFIPETNIVNSQSSQSTDDGYFTVKISNAYTSATILASGGMTSADAGEPIVLEYIPDEDIDVKVGSYSKNTTESVIDVTVTNDCKKEDSAYNIADYYRGNNDIENIHKFSDFSFLFFSDVHQGTENVERVIELSNDLGDKVDCIINGGDTVGALMGDGLSWYNSLVDMSKKPILNVAGNHDCWISQWNWADAVSVYNLVTAKVASQANVVQPSGAAENGLNYYYKDFGPIRVVCLLAMQSGNDNLYFDSEQLSWFNNVLEDARTTIRYYKMTSNGLEDYTLQSGDSVSGILSNMSEMNGLNVSVGEIYGVRMSVMAVSHAPFKGNVNVISEKLCSWRNYTIGDIITTRTYRDNIELNADAFNAVDTYINNGGSFICWLTGHTHTDAIVKKGQQMMININSARFDIKPDGVSEEDVTNPNYDSFDYVGVDLEMGFIKVLRIGYAKDSSMRVRRSWCYDYVNGVLVSSN